MAASPCTRVSCSVARVDPCWCRDRRLPMASSASYTAWPRLGSRHAPLAVGSAEGRQHSAHRLVLGLAFASLGGQELKACIQLGPTLGRHLPSLEGPFQLPARRRE